MKDCLIRKAVMNDIPRIMEFIDTYWKKGHILARSREFFEYQHVWKNEVCYVVAENPDTKEMEGILGYIVYSETSSRDLFGAIWKVRSNNYPMLGMKMQLFALRQLGARTFSAVALNPTTLSMHRHWGAYMGQLNQYYILGDFDEYIIAHIENYPNRTYDKSKMQYAIKRIHNYMDLYEICEEEKERNKVPIKSLEFIKHRYFLHPVYEYHIYGVFDKEGKLKSAVIAREICIKNRKIIRIVDYLGNEKYISHIGRALYELLMESRYEYIDFYEYGVKAEYMESAGFVLREKNDKNIIPNYFEPFVQENIDIDFYTSEKNGGVVLFKGDGDQDRPNKL